MRAGGRASELTPALEYSRARESRLVGSATVTSDDGRVAERRNRSHLSSHVVLRNEAVAHLRVPQIVEPPSTGVR